MELQFKISIRLLQSKDNTIVSRVTIVNRISSIWFLYYWNINSDKKDMRNIFLDL